ncbi:MAG: M48 family metalloprotease [Acidipila sp.]|nr:M48 family metalloprotease [Acidipila sp.]
MDKTGDREQTVAEAVNLRQSMRQALALVAAFMLVLAPLASAQRTALSPGWNMFSPQQDVEVGQQAARDVERQVPMLNDARVDNYLNNLGQRLATHAPGYKFPYTYRAVNDKAVNAFALPGGRIYINRGVLEIADTEAQLAGVMAHETSHVALRHGTNQASKASAAQLPLAILGGLMGNSTGAMLAQLGAGFTLNSILLKYSRTDESQADVMGTQILYDSGYDPRGMTQFLEKLQQLDKGGHHIQFFASHPSPDRRVERTATEVDKLGAPRGNAMTNSPEFDQIKRYVRSLPPPPAKGQRQLQGSTGGSGNGGYPNGGYPNGGSTGTRRNSRGLQILAASYGARDTFADVRQQLQSQVQNDRLDMQVNNSSLGGDPLPNEPKTLNITYEWGGVRHQVTVPENQQVSIPTQQDQSAYGNGTPGGTQTNSQVDWPSERVKNFSNSVLQLSYPDNWQAYGQGDAVTFAPANGMVDDGSGNKALAYGVLVNIYDPHRDSNNGQQLQPRGYGQGSAQNSSTHLQLEQDTDQLVADFRQSNRNMRIVRRHQDITVDGQDGVSTYLSNESPLGGRETNWLVTVSRPQGLLFFVFTAPEGDFQNFESTFQQMLYSARIIR